MPLLDDDQMAAIDLAKPIDVPKGFTVTPGSDDLSGAPDGRPMWNWGAAFRRNNELAALASSESAWVDNDPEPGFNSWDKVRGTEDEVNFRRLATARNERKFNAIKADIGRENEDRKRLDAQPWWMGLLTEGPAAVLSPTTFLPGGAFVRGARGGLSLGKSALSVGGAAAGATGLQEAALHGIEQTRTPMESATAIGASALLGGLLGTGGAALLSKAEWRGAVEALNRELGGETPTVPVPVGAAATEAASLDDLSIAGRAARAVAKTTEGLNPALRLTQSPSAVARNVATKTFENPLYLKMNMEGMTQGAAVETLMKEWNGGLASALDATDKAFPEARKSGFTGTALQFREEVGKAMRRGDVHPNKQVEAVAKQWRKDVFDPLKEAAIKVGLLPEDVTVETAISYFSRLYNVNKLIRQEGQFKGVVSQYYRGAIGKEYQNSLSAHNQKMARLDQEVADLTLTPEQRVATAQQLESAQTYHEATRFDLSERADRLSEIASAMRQAKEAKDEAAMTRLRAERAGIIEAGGKELAEFREERAAFNRRRRNVELGQAGLADRSDRLMNQLADLEETNFRAMERLVKKGQQLERDLNRLDADAMEGRITQLSEQYSAIAKRAEASAERARSQIGNINKRAAAKEVKNIEKGAEIAAESDTKIKERLTKEAERQTGFAQRMDKVAERLRLAVDFSQREGGHDGLMAEIKDAIEKAMRETSAQSMARGERAARLGERLAQFNPDRVKARIQLIEEMKKASERAFFDRWEIRAGGEGVGTKTPDFSRVADDIANEAFDSLTGKTIDPQTRPEFLKITARGPMKDRTLNIPDELIEEWLESDVAQVGRRYTRVMGSDVELANKFGDVNMTEQLKAIRDDYARMRQGMTDDEVRRWFGARKGLTAEEKLALLDKAERDDIRDISAVRDSLRGTLEQQANAGNYAAITRMANAYNYIRSMGEVVLASLTDAIRPAMVHGLMQFMGDAPKMASAGAKASIQEAKLAGNVSERVLHHRLGTMFEIFDPYSGKNPIEAFLAKGTDLASRWNGIRMWTDFMKSVSSVMTQNRILNNVGKYGDLPQKEKAYLAYLGIDANMADRIAAQFAKHGETVDGVRVANTEEWTRGLDGAELDKARAEVRAYRAAMNKDIDSIIVQKGVADLPLLANTPTGRALLQFKSFALASHQRILLRGLQEDQARFVGGVVAMTMMGMFITYMKALSGNRPENIEKMMSNPGWWVGEAVDRAGIASVPMELSNMVEKMTATAGYKFNPLKAPFTAFDESGSISQKNQNRNFMGSLLGPTGGLAEDLATGVAGVGVAGATGQDITQGRKNALERVLPYNSYLGMRQMLRYVVNPPE